MWDETVSDMNLKRAGENLGYNLKRSAKGKRKTRNDLEWNLKQSKKWSGWVRQEVSVNDRDDESGRELEMNWNTNGKHFGQLRSLEVF